jgi:hypothetical protein
MSETTVRKPSVKITAPGGEVSAEGITFIAAVNSAPTVEVILRRAKETVVEPMAADVIAAMKQLQQARFAMKSGTPDTTVTADDGNGGKLTFKGFLTAPVLEQSTVSSSETANVVGSDAFLNGLGLGIYSSRPQNVRGEEIDNLFEATPSRTNGDIASLIREVTDVLVGNYQATLDKAETDSLKNVLEKKHAANTTALKVWRDILSGSDVRYPEWQNTLSDLPKIGEAVAERVKEMLQQRTSSFWDVLNGLGSEFLFFYKPKMDGSSGDLVRADKKVNDDGGKSLDAGVVRYSGTDGSPSMLPLGGVIVYGPPIPGLRKEESPYAVTTVVGQWPVEISPGYFQEISAPAWMAAGGFTSFETEKSTEAATGADPGTKKNLDPTNYKERRTGRKEKLVAVEGAMTKMLQEFAKVTYEDMRLADSTATLEIPLDFKIEVGVRYKFKTSEDGGAFTGFVRALRHTLQLQGGTTLTSGTVLSLSHIQYE